MCNTNSLSHKKASIPATALLMIFSVFSISFFYSSMAPTPVSRVAGLVTGAYYSLLLFLILRSGKPGNWRRVFFVSIAMFFFPEFIGNIFDLRGHMTVNPQDIVTGDVPYCMIVNVMTIIPMLLTKTVIFPGRLMGFYASIYSMLTLWLVSSMILGRGWCGWMCFFGGWDDGFSRSAKKARLSLLGKESKIREFNQGMMVFVILASMSTLTAVYCVWLCPFKIITEYELISNIGSFIATIMFILLFFGLTMVLPYLTRKRFQCSAFCPLGPLQSIIDRITPFGIRIDPAKCSKCMACVKVCATMSLDEKLISDGERKPNHSCTKCGDCVQVCPQAAIRYNLRPADWVRRRFGLDEAREANSAAKKPLAAPVAWLLSLGKELLEPRHLFTVTAFILGCALSYTFAMGTISRVINLILSGAFTRGY